MKKLFIRLIVLTVMLCFTTDIAAKKDNRTEFIKGFDEGKAFCKSPGKKCYKSLRNGIQKMHERYGPWCWKYARNSYVACLSRIWLESRGNPWSHTKDTHLEEAGLTSVSKMTANRICKEHGVCGDPCGDPEFSISVSSWRGAEQRKNMFTGVKDPEAAIPEPTFWASWIPQQWEDNRIEAEYLMSICGGTNCTKLKRALKRADKDTRKKGIKPFWSKGIFEHLGKDGKRHTYWNLVKWLKKQKQGELLFEDPETEDQSGLFAPLAVSLWRFGFRWGRVVSSWIMRGEFFPPIQGSNGDEPQKNYCWGDTPWWSADVPFSTPLFKKPKNERWRKRCVLYSTKSWDKIWDEPKCTDRWKTGGFKYHPISGVPIKVKKKEKKYTTQAECDLAKEIWKDTQQAQGLLPSDKEYSTWEMDMAKVGCAFRYIITNN